MITFDGIEVRFGDFVALTDFSLTIGEGEFFTLLGPSGCGKTTALRALAGLNEPSKGSIHIDGTDVTTKRSDQRNLGMVFQNYALFPSMTVFDNIAFGLSVKKEPKSEVTRRVHEVAREVDLSEAQLDKQVSELSGGQQQRVAIARSLVLRPRVLLMDEPLSNLDAKLRQQMRGQLKELQESFGITTVYVTHDQDEALSLSTRIAVMNGGVIEQVGTPQEIYEQSSTEFVCTFIGEVNRLAPGLVNHLIGRGVAIARDAATYLRREKILWPREGVPIPDDHVEVRGIITQTSYTGIHTTYSIDAGEFGELRTVRREDGSAPLTKGSEVTVHFHPRHVLSYGDAAAPAGGVA